MKMNPPRNDQWELSLDIDDSDLRLTQSSIPATSYDVAEDEDFKCGSLVRAVEFRNAYEGIVSGCLGDIKNYLKNGKLDQVVAIIKSCTPNALEDLTVTLKDLLVCSPEPSIHCLNITMRNLVKVFHKDTVPRNGSGVGASGMLDQ
ncbi:reverse transcriptase zinc-binding domain-containing protein [Tanacetum coccineum]